jgi:hypothetical protein
VGFGDVQCRAVGNFISLTPGFSRVRKTLQMVKPFQRLPGAEKPLKRFSYSLSSATGLKPGINEMVSFISASFDAVVHTS